MLYDDKTTLHAAINVQIQAIQIIIFMKLINYNAKYL